MAELENVENSRAKLNPVHAQFFQNAEAVSVPLTDTKEVRVLWEYSTEQEYSELENFLQAYTWPTNIGPKRYVKDPVIAGEKLDGTWRQAFVSRIKRDAQNGTSDLWIALTLRRGWAEELNWDEARLVQGLSAQGNDQSLASLTSDDKTGLVQITFPGFSPFKSEEAIVAVAESLTDQKVQGQVLEGLWYINVARTQEEDDGSISLILTVAQDKYVLNSYRDYGFIRSSLLAYAYNVPKGIAQDLLDELKLAGYSATIAYNKNSEVVDITSSRYVYNSKEIAEFKSAINCDSTTYTTIYLGEEDENAHLITEPVPAGTTARRSVQERYGAYDIIIVREVRNKREYDEYLASIGVLSQSEVTQRFGITLEEDDTALGAPIQGEVTTLQRRVQRDCSKDEVITTVTDLPDTSAEYVSRETAAAKNEDILYRNQPAPVEHPKGQAVGRIVTARNTETRSGLFDATVSESESKQQSLADVVSKDDDFVQTKTTRNKNATTPTVVASAAGTAVQLQFNLNDYGQVDEVVVVETAKEVTETHTSRKSALASETSTSVLNAAVDLVVPAHIPGTTYRGQQRPNRFGLKDHTLITQNAVAASTGDKDSRKTALSTTVTDRRLNQAAAPEAPARAAGEISSAQASPNDAGLFDGAVVVETAGAPIATVAVSSRDSLATNTTTEHRNKVAAVEAPARAAGQLSRASSSVNAFGLFDGSTMLSVLSELNTVDKLSSSAVLYNEEASEYRNVASVPLADAYVQGVLSNTSWRVNASGLYDGTRTTRTASAAITTATTSNRDALSTVGSIERRNSVAAIEAPARVVGEISGASSSINAFGLFDGATRVSTAILLETLNVTTRTSLRYTEETSEYRNAVAAPVADAYVQGVLSRTTFRVNAAGRYDGTKVNRTANLAAADEDFTSLTSQGGDTQTSLKYNEAVVPDATPAVQGVIERVGAQRTEDDLFSVRVDTTSSKDQDLNIPLSQETLYRSTETDVFTAKDAIPPPAAAVEGQIRQLNANIGADGTYSGTTSLLTKEGNAWTFTYKTGKSDGYEYDVKVYGFLEVTKADVDVVLAALDAGWTNSNSVSGDDTGRYSGTIVSRDPDGNSGYFSQWWVNLINDTVEWREARVRGRATVTHYMGRGVFTSKVTAETYLNAAVAGAQAVNTGEADFKFIRGVGYEVLRVREAT